MEKLNFTSKIGIALFGFFLLFPAFNYSQDPTIDSNGNGIIDALI